MTKTIFAFGVEHGLIPPCFIVAKLKSGRSHILTGLFQCTAHMAVGETLGADHERVHMLEKEARKTLSLVGDVCALDAHFAAHKVYRFRTL